MSAAVEVSDRAGSGVDPAWARRLVEGVLAREGRAVAVHVVLVGDAAIRDLNRRFHGRDRPTDVLAFPAAGAEEGVWDPAGESPAAEVVVSVETARREAELRGVAAESELALYVIHGVLHVLGYDDRTPDATRRMRAAEARHLEAAGHPRDLHAASRDEGDQA